MAEFPWLLNKKHLFSVRKYFSMHQISKARCITARRGSIIVLCHFVHRAFVLEAGHISSMKATVKHDKLLKREESGTMTPSEQDTLVEYDTQRTFLAT